jgi:5-methyltetrahydropteroyltriglutamate--homocysteine methyltransferase
MAADRFLTTHTGSLARPEDLFKAMWAKEQGVAVDKPALAARITSAVAEIVAKQNAAGVDIVSDGELSKPSYSTYVKDRLAGFGGTVLTKPMPLKDVMEFPGLEKRRQAAGGPQRHNRPACDGPISVKDRAALDADIANMSAALQAAGLPPERGFMTAASPGVVTEFFANQHYKSHEDYVAAIAEAMRPEYEAIANAGFILQLDCPDLAMGKHIAFGDLSLAEFRKVAALHVEALNHATRAIAPERMRIHLCWGNYEGPHHHDVELKDIVDIVLKARPAGISLEAANPRHAHEWKLWETVKLPDGKYLIPGVLESKSNFIEHPELVAQRIGRYASIVGRERVVAGSDCGFSTFVDTARIDPDVVWKKLAAMAEGARLATREFWGK